MKKQATILFIICLGIFLTRMVFAGGVTLRWDEVRDQNLAGYKIYYKSGVTGGGPYDGKRADQGYSPTILYLKDMPDIAQPEYKLTGLPSGTYWMVVTAFDQTPIESGFSNEVSATIQQALISPSGLTTYQIEHNGQLIIININ